MELALWLGHWTECNPHGVIAKLSLRLSLNKPFKWLVGRAITILKNMSSSMGRMTSQIFWKIKNMFETTNQMTLFKGHFPPNDRKRERERERKRASELDARWCGTVSAGNKAPKVEFLSSVLPVGWMCTTVFAWFTPSLMVSCTFPGYRFWGSPIALQCFMHISDKQLLQY